MAKINRANREALSAAFSQRPSTGVRFVHIVARNLTELRELRGLTKAQAAALCKVSPRTWYLWESDLETSTGAAVGGALDSIAQAFGVPVERLLQIPKPSRAPRSKEKPRDGKSARRFARKAVAP